MDLHEDDIDCTGFELGMPTREEMLEQQCRLLESEIEELCRELRASRQRVAKLVVMFADSENQVAELMKEIKGLA